MNLLFGHNFCSFGQKENFVLYPSVLHPELFDLGIEHFRNGIGGTRVEKATQCDKYRKRS